MRWPCPRWTTRDGSKYGDIDITLNLLIASCQRAKEVNGQNIRNGIAQKSDGRFSHLHDAPLLLLTGFFNNVVTELSLDH